jgi:hypothetical protein
MINWEIVGAIVGVIAGFTAIYLFLDKTLPRIIDYFKLKKYNKHICSVIVELRNEYLEEIYDMNTAEDVKDFVIEKSHSGYQKPIEKEEFVAFAFPSSTYNSIKNLDLDGISLIIEWGIKREIRENLTKRGIDYEDADELAKEDTKDFVEKKLGKVIKKRKSIEAIKTKVSREETVSVRRTYIKRNYTKIREVVRKSFNNNLKESYEKYMYNSKEYKDLIKTDITEIIKGVRARKSLREELDIRKAKGEGFNKNTTEKLIDLKKAFLTNRAAFIKRINAMSNRSEEIYSLILANPGLYELEMSNLFNIPQPTISIYCDEMSKKKFVIKDTFSTTGNYVYLYPLFTNEEIKENLNALMGYDIGIITKVRKKENIIYLELYDAFKIDLSSTNISDMERFLGCEVFLKVRFNKDTITVLSVGVVKQKIKQEALTKYFPIVQSNSLNNS